MIGRKVNPKTLNGPVIVKPSLAEHNPSFWSRALELAEGDVSKIRVVSYSQISVDTTAR